MEVKDYCKNMQMELNSWKAKLYDVVRKSDRLPESEKQKMQQELRDIHSLVSDLDDRIDQLQTNCPAEWEAQKGEISSKVGRLSEKYEEIWHYPGFGESSKPAA